MNWRRWLQQSVRRKLLAMALLPTLVMLPLVVGALLWWGDIVYDKLLIAKVRSDLAVARGYFDHVVDRVTAGTRAVAGSQALLERLQRRDAGELDWFLEQQRRRLELDFLVVTPAAETLPHAAIPLTGGLALWDLHQLQAVAPALAQRVGPIAAGTSAPRVLVIVSRTEVSDGGRRVATVLGGILLNQNLELVDRINSIVYPEGALPLGSHGTTTLFMGDVRVSTNVRLFPNERAIGTLASPEVRDAVLTKGRTWLDRAYVVDAWYVSGYEPLLDTAGRRVGMLYVGYLEEPFRLAKWGILGLTGLIFLAGILLTLLVSLRWAATIFRPVERMHEVIRQVEQGARTARVGGAIATHDEIGSLAAQFDKLLDRVEDNRTTLERWAQELEDKVATRARELASTNRSLQAAHRQLVQSEKLAAIGQVTAAMAHEINNPIAVMQGNLDLVRELLQEKTEIVAPELKLLDEQVERIRTMVSHLLRSARPSEYAGYVETLDPDAVVEESLVLSSHLVTERLHVVRDYQATQGVEFNHQELQQLLVNLVTNAIQAMPEGGTLTLRTRDWSEDGRVGAVIEVQDTGTGVPAHIREQLFLPLFTTRPEGNGLGLWISLSLVERYGGTIEVENAAGGGAVFRVRLLSEAFAHLPAAADQD